MVAKTHSLTLHTSCNISKIVAFAKHPIRVGTSVLISNGEWILISDHKVMSLNPGPIPIDNNPD